jgi:hypothetical protein
MTDYMATLGITKETDNKVRWDVYVHDVRFSIYVPKVHVPAPWPSHVRVGITVLEAEKAQQAASIDEASPDLLTTVVSRFEDKTRTVRYRPIGDQTDWLIGEPYIPYEVLEEVSPLRTPEQLVISLDWP